MTREQLCAMLYRYAATRAENAAPGETDLEAFVDSGEISSWAEDAIRWAVGEGIVNGVGDGRLAPKGTATRAQTAALICRLISYFDALTEN